MIAVDGKTLRGSGHGSDGSRHLLAALDHAHGVVLVTRDLLRGHLAERHPGHPRPARRHHLRPVEHRGPPALGPRLDFDEDHSQVRTAAGLQIMASLRNLAITILRLAGTTSIAAALRYHARRPARPLRTTMKC